jgi:D-alanyl-D-alanine carboxypeptidase/D-alanyl-D-alanine-endopeptidase (penicillin-binding protein 4)
MDPLADKATGEVFETLQPKRIGSLLTGLRKSLAIFILTAILAPALTLEGRAGSIETIQTKIAQFLKRPGVRSVQWGIQVLDPATSEVLVEVNPDKTFLPASVLKVVTTSTALERLGPDFKYRTGVYTNGAVEPDGTVKEDLILVGRGDPNLMDPYGELFEKPALLELAEKLKDLGIRKVEGKVIGDDSYFDSNSYGMGWTSKDLKSLYGAPINALSINNNVVWVQARPTKYNRPVSIELEPRTSYFHIRNLGITGSRRSRRTLYVRLNPGTNTLVVSGVLPSTQTHSQYVVLGKPAEATATLFKEELQRNQIAVLGRVCATHNGDFPQEVKQGWRLLAEHQSPPLIRALEIINKRSQNLHAEMLLRTLGAEFKGEGSNEAGLQVVKEFLVETGIDSGKIKLNDGCGLSRDNLITPRFQTSLLQFLSTRPYFSLFLNTLAVSGTDGTLRNRLSATEVRGSIHAKTGTLNGVAALSGYLTTRSGRNLVFSIFANHVNAMARAKRTIDEICSLFVNLY